MYEVRSKTKYTWMRHIKIIMLFSTDLIHLSSFSDPIPVRPNLLRGMQNSCHVNHRWADAVINWNPRIYFVKYSPFHSFDCKLKPCDGGEEPEADVSDHIRPAFELTGTNSLGLREAVKCSMNQHRDDVVSGDLSKHLSDSLLHLHTFGLTERSSRMEILGVAAAFLNSLASNFPWNCSSKTPAINKITPFIHKNLPDV